MSDYKNNMIVSWEDFFLHCQQLAEKLPKDSAWKGIVAITRSGLWPAAALSEILDIRLIETICIASYEEKAQKKLRILKDIETVAGAGENWLVIDDMVDTGCTMEIVHERLPKAHKAVLYAKSAGQHLADSHAVDVAQETWIYHPWEKQPLK